MDAGIGSMIRLEHSWQKAKPQRGGRGVIISSGRDGRRSNGTEVADKSPMDYAASVNVYKQMFEFRVLLNVSPELDSHAGN